MPGKGQALLGLQANLGCEGLVQPEGSEGGGQAHGRVTRESGPWVHVAGRAWGMRGTGVRSHPLLSTPSGLCSQRRQSPYHPMWWRHYL